MNATASVTDLAAHRAAKHAEHARANASRSQHPSVYQAPTGSKTLQILSLSRPATERTAKPA